MDISRKRTGNKKFKILSLSLAIIFVLLGFSACGKKNETTDAAETEKHSEYQWPRSDIAQLIPKPESTAGEVCWDEYDGFNIDVANTTQEQFNDYVNACADNGFTIEYSRGDDYYYAKNENGYDLSLVYHKDKTVMNINLDSPDEEEETTTAKKTTTKKATKTSKTKKETSSVEWKEFLKEYEEWVDDYIDLVNKYKDNPNDMSILADYTEQMGKLASWSEKADKVKADLENNPEDLAEYTKTLTRILGKLSEIQ